MSGKTKELLQICEQLPQDQRKEVADFARFLLSRQDEERWEEMISSPESRPKLDAFLQESAAESAAPLDADKL